MINKLCDNCYISDYLDFSSSEKKDYIKKISSFIKDTQFNSLEEKILQFSLADSKSLEKNDIIDCIEKLIPWRKGPYFFSQFENLKIDSEWDSEKKWQRIDPYLNLKDKTILDIGCNNGYFLFKSIEKKPKLAYGIDPVYRYYLQYFFIKNILYKEHTNLFFDLLGVEDLILFKKKFDMIFCMGILYHHRDPIGILRNIHQSLNTGGEVLVDCQGIEGNKSYCLFVEKKYTNANGFWFLPTLSALENWLKRSGFRDIKTIYNEYLSTDEQKTSKDSPFPSLKEAIRENLTIEGYPLPKRFYLIAKK